MWISTQFCVYAAQSQASIFPSTAMISVPSHPSSSDLNTSSHWKMVLAQELVLFRDDGENLAVCKAPPPSDLGKHNSHGKSLLRSESRVQTKLEEAGAAAPNSCNLSW